jgi:hypothetical protein
MPFLQGHEMARGLGQNQPKKTFLDSSQSSASASDLFGKNHRVAHVPKVVCI